MKKENKLHITIEITQGVDRTILNHDSFDQALLSFVNEMGWYMYREKKELIKQTKKAMKK
jgi:hypothetical protein